MIRLFYIPAEDFGLLRRLSCLFSLYRFSRDLARFESQTILSGFPADFLLKQASKTSFKDLPQTPEERLGLFLKQAGPSLQTLAAFFSLYPEVAGTDRSSLLSDAIDRMPEFTDKASSDEQKRFERILKIFYTLTNKDPCLKHLAEKFENLLNEDVDFRFKAAALERLNDNFYEDDCLKTLIPDWLKTDKNKLSLISNPDLRFLQASANKEKTASCLIKSVILMILRDGFVIAPTSAVCRTDASGTLYFINACLPVLLSDRERIFISSFLKSLCAKDYQQAAKTLLTSGFSPAYFPPPRLIRLIEETDRQTDLLPPGRKADYFLKSFADNGIFFPFAVRYCVFAIKNAEKLCRTELNAENSIWQNGKTEFSDFLTKGKEISSFAQRNTEDILSAFSLEPHHAERLALQHKKAPSFQENPKKIADLLYNHTMAARFQPSDRRKKTEIFFIFAVLLILLSFYLK